MSCIAGVGGGVRALVRVATSGRPIIGLDGCLLQCVRHCLAQEGVEADLHVVLSDYGVRKKRHQDFDPDEAQAVLDTLKTEIAATFAEVQTTS